MRFPKAAFLQVSQLFNRKIPRSAKVDNLLLRPCNRSAAAGTWGAISAGTVKMPCWSPCNKSRAALPYRPRRPVSQSRRCGRNVGNGHAAGEQLHAHLAHGRQIRARPRWSHRRRNPEPSKSQHACFPEKLLVRGLSISCIPGFAGRESRNAVPEIRNGRETSAADRRFPQLRRAVAA